MIDIQTILTYLTLISVPVGVIYHIMALNNTRKNQRMQLETRQAQLYMSLINNWNTKEFNRVRYNVYRMDYTDLDDWNSKYSREKTPEQVSDVTTFGRSILSLAELKRKGLIDCDFLDGMMLIDILNWWLHFGRLEKERWERGIPAWYGHFPFIKEVIEYDRKNRPAGYDKEGRYRFAGNKVWVQPEEIMELRERFIKTMANTAE